MQERRNYYRILQAQPDAPVDVIRSNYRTLMQKLRMHPDLGGDERDAATLNLAYQTLCDPERRAQYDRALLDRYSVRELGQGGAERLGQVPAAGEGGDRRNYYRVLQVQHDARAPIIEASYRTLKDQVAGEELAQVEAAYAVLGDPRQRRAYDTATRLSQAPSPGEGQGNDETREHPLRARASRSPADEGSLPRETSTSYEPIILRYCAFCKTPHAEVPAATEQARDCVVCDSPLATPPGASDAVGEGRDAIRLEWHSQVTLRLDWPQPVLSATVCDLSPHGALVECAAPLEVGAIVRLEGESVCAVCKVIHRLSAGDGSGEDPTATRVGLQFLTARFEQAQGTFVCAQA